MLARNWSDVDIEYLRDSAKNTTSSEIAQHLGVPLDSVRNAAKKRGIRFMVERMQDGSERRRWSVQDISALHGLAESGSIERAARHLGRTRGAVKGKAYALGLRFMEDRMKLADLASLLGISGSTLANRRNRLGLAFRTAKKGKANGNTRGASAKDVIAIAQDLLDRPAIGCPPRVSARHLRDVIEEYKTFGCGGY